MYKVLHYNNYSENALVFCVFCAILYKCIYKTLPELLIKYGTRDIIYNI